MIEEKSIKKLLELQGFPVDETDILYTQGILAIVKQAQTSLTDFPDLYKEKPITVVDKEVLAND